MYLFFYKENLKILLCGLIDRDNILKKIAVMMLRIKSSMVIRVITVAYVINRILMPGKCVDKFTRSAIQQQ